MSRSVDRSRRRRMRAQVPPNTEGMGPITLNDGAILQGPSDDKDAPELPAAALSLHPPCGSYESSTDSGGSQGYSGRVPGSQKPERKGGKPGGPSRQRPRADFQHAQGVGDEEFLARRQSSPLATPGSVMVTGRDPQDAIHFPLAGLASCDALFPIGDRPRSFGRPGRAVDFKGMPPTKTFVAIVGILSPPRSRSAAPTRLH